MLNHFSRKIILVGIDRVFLSFAVGGFPFCLYLSDMARIPKFRRLPNGELILGYTREANEVFKKNSEEQDKRRDRNEPQLMSKPPEEVHKDLD